MDSIVVGVLALQGAFAKHIAMLHSLNVQTKEVRKPEELGSCDGLIIPGGESTTIRNQMHYIQFEEKLKEFAERKPVFGTCAGIILMAKKIVGDEMQPFGFLDITIERNAFGRQGESFSAFIEMSWEKKKLEIPAIFIRAPRIRSYNSSVKVIGFLEGEPVLVQEQFHLGASFHPELTQNSTIHEYFLQLIRQNKEQFKKVS